MCIMVDMPYHGASPLQHPTCLSQLQQLAPAIVEESLKLCDVELEAKETVLLGIGHSFGGTFLLHVELERGIFHHLLLWEPILQGREFSPKARASLLESMSKRTDVWPTYQQASQSLRSARYLQRLSAEVLEEYIRGVLRTDADSSTTRLVNSNHKESQYYAHSMPLAVYSNFLETLNASTAPLTVLVGERSSHMKVAEMQV